MSEELGDVDNIQVLTVIFIISNISAHFGVIFSEKVEYNTSLKVSHSQIAIINTLYKLLLFYC